MTSTWGKMLKMTLFGQSHGVALGLVLDGLPAGFHLDTQRLQAFMWRRAPGLEEWTSSRQEQDKPQFICGLKDDTITGTPLAALIYNQDSNSADYQSWQNIARPGHADFTVFARYGMQAELIGGGFFSGRLTAPLCLAGGIAMQILEQQNIYIGAHIQEIGGIIDSSYDPILLTKEQLLIAGSRDFPVNDLPMGEQMKKSIRKAQQEKDSLGGIIEGAALGLPTGVGSPPFGGIENRLSQILFAIPALVGLEFGSGFGAAKQRGSQNNDPFIVEQGQIRTAGNNHGGVLGGISSGMPLIFRVAIKPTPSIAKEQRSVNMTTLQETKITVQGRHDPCIAPRALPCVVAATALALLDMMLEQGKIL
ncbi:MAG: chorismate synthase [Firmicutes bacterium]|nr:chorismate synthase [Bacillota bacterium]